MVDFLTKINDRASDSFRQAQGAIRGTSGDAPGFSNTAPIPAPNGARVRQAEVANNRDARAVRNMVRWFLPETGVVEMYINPESIKYGKTKHIPTPVRTRGGYIVQYWGEELGSLSLSGTTGSSGVEGINVLEEIYRHEQVAMDALALAAEAAREREAETNGLLGGLLGGESLLGGVGSLLGVPSTDEIFDRVNNVIESGNVDPVTPKPTLASIAFQVEMYWSGWVHRGYFKSFTVTESVQKLGLFDYSLEFVVTQKRGLRLNFFPWHRSAVNGPSNSDPAFGTPYSFGFLRDEVPINSQEDENLSRIIRLSSSIDRALQSYRAL